MDFKLVLFCLGAFVCVSEAIRCYECDKHVLNGVATQDDFCDDSDETDDEADDGSCSDNCFTLEQEFEMDLSGQTVIYEFYSRGCSSTTSTRCDNRNDLSNAEEDLWESIADLANIFVADDASLQYHKVCYCDYDYCNGATAATVTMAMLLMTSLALIYNSL